MIVEGIAEYFESSLRRARRDILLFCPFIKIDALKRLLKSIDEDVKVEIITTWKVRNFWEGVSDVELYPYCRDKSVLLYGNDMLHMKVALIDEQILLLTSANITKVGLGYSTNSNIESLTELEATSSVIEKLESIKSSSILIDDALYRQAADILKSIAPKPEFSLEEVTFEQDDKPCLVQDLPSTESIGELYKEYEKGNLEEMNSQAREDLYKYEIPLKLDRDLFHQYVHRKFHSLPIIKAIEEELAIEPKYFGQMKELLQQLDESSPKPYRRELTPVTQNLYRWLVDLDPEIYEVARPNYSEKIQKI